MKKHLPAGLLAFALLAGTSAGYAQHWSIGGNMGFSSFYRSPGFQVTPTAELHINRNMGIGTELSINTQYGAPILWYPYFRYYFDIRRSFVKPYVNAGPVMAVNVPNGPSFGFLFGGGVNIPIARNLYIAPDFIFGPVFAVGGGKYPFIVQGNYWGYRTYGLLAMQYPSWTEFTFSMRGGLRYEL